MVWLKYELWPQISLIYHDLNILWPYQKKNSYATYYNIPHKYQIG